VNRKFLVLSLVFFVGQRLYAQTPAHWSFTATKTGDKEFTIHLTVRIDPNWHIYSQVQPETAVARPTKIQFTNNPVIVLSGKAEEVGKVEHWSDAASGIAANQYEDKVDFVQDVKVKGKFKVNITGKLAYQVCTDKMCLPPATIPFSIPLQP
jgi:hypothetical protein